MGLKKKTYPAKIKVRRKVYELLLTHKMANAADLAYCLISAEKDVRQIVIQGDLSDKKLFETFIHEALHSIENEYCLEIPHSLIVSLEVPLTKLLLDNFDIKWKKP